MKIGFLGLGKLGLPCALAVESRGHPVIGCDISARVVADIRARKIPYREEGAQEALEKSAIEIVDIPELVQSADIIFVLIQTPHEPRYEGITRLPAERADFDYSALKSGIKSLSDEIGRGGEDKVVIVISTVLPGTIEREIRPLLNPHIRLCYNPFFIAAGTTMRDFLHPEFVLLGADDDDAAAVTKRFYATIHDAPVFQTTIASAELAKVSYNTFISMKIAFINTIMEICHKTGANVDAVSDSIALATTRLISPAYLRGGMGDGGGYHPRDNIALSWLARELNLSHDFFDSLMQARERQTEWLADLMEEYGQDLPKVILGRSFKPESNIVVGSPALLLEGILRERGEDPAVWDPHLDGDMPKFEPSVFLIGTRHELFREIKFPAGSVVVDPWRYIPDQEGVRVVRVGE